MRSSTPLRLNILLLSFVLIMGCGGGQGPTDGTVTITFWHSFVASTRPALDNLIERFEEEHPNIRVNAQYVPTGDGLIQKLIAGVQSGTAPDISWVHADFLGKLVEADAIYKMDTFIQGPNGLSREEMEDIFPGLLQAARWRDTLYAMPMEATLLALFYNKDHFRQAGLDPNRPPRTWEELHAYARQLTRDENGDGKQERFGFYVPVFPASGPYNIWMSLQWSAYLWQAGGAVINPEQTEVLYDGEAGVQALTFWRDLYRDTGPASASLSHDMSFAAQQSAMVMDGPWDLPRFREIEQFEWGIAPLPAGPAKQVTYLAGEHLAIFKQSDHPEEAWTFIKWVLQPEVQAAFSTESGYLPVRQSALDLPGYQEYLASDPALRAFVEQMPLGQAREPIDYYHVEINSHIAKAIERALIGGTDPRIALDESATESNRLLRALTAR